MHIIQAIDQYLKFPKKICYYDNYGNLYIEIKC